MLLLNLQCQRQRIAPLQRGHKRFTARANRFEERLNLKAQRLSRRNRRLQKRQPGIGAACEGCPAAAPAAASCAKQRGIYTSAGNRCGDLRA